jgi:hypothetical protein
MDGRSSASPGDTVSVQVVEEATMNTTAHHGVHGCYCEDCLGNRIRISVEPASPELRIRPVRARRLRLRVRLASEAMPRRAS